MNVLQRLTIRPFAVLALVAAAPLAAATVVLFRYDPAHFGFYPRCVLFVLTGLYCPGCGALRASHQLVHGNLLGALDYNPFFVVALPFLAYAVAGWATAALGRPLPTYRPSGRATWALFAVIVGFTVLRNLPYPPFDVLAP